MTVLVYILSGVFQIARNGAKMPYSQWRIGLIIIIIITLTLTNINQHNKHNKEHINNRTIFNVILNDRKMMMAAWRSPYTITMIVIVKLITKYFQLREINNNNCISISMVNSKATLMQYKKDILYSAQSMISLHQTTYFSFSHYYPYYVHCSWLLLYSCLFPSLYLFDIAWHSILICFYFLILTKYLSLSFEKLLSSSSFIQIQMLSLPCHFCSTPRCF